MAWELPRHCSGAGLKVALADLNGETAEHEAAALRDLGREAFGFALDVADAEGWGRLVAEVVARWGGLDVLVNNAGISPRSTAETTDEALWERTIGTNLKGAWLGIKTAMPYLKKSKGTIVNNGSTHATIPLRNMFVYGVSKAGLLGLTRQVAMEYLHDGVTCNMFSPGWVASPGERVIQEAEGRPDFPAGCLFVTPIEDVGALVVYLISEGARFITGETIHLDGCLHACGDVRLGPSRGGPISVWSRDNTTMAEFLHCLNTSTIRPTPLLDKIRVAGAVGFQAVEPWNDEITEYLQQGGTLADLKTAIADAGLKVVSMIALHGWITAEGDEYRQVLDECRRRLEQAAALGSPYIVASPPREIVNLERASQRYAELLKLGRAFGVKPSVEFLGFVEGINSVAAAWAIAAGACDPEATIVPDVFHLLRGGRSVEDLLMIGGHRIAVFHINDLPASPLPSEQTDQDRVHIGEGIAKLPRVIALLRTIGYRGPLSLELFNKTLWTQDPAEVARKGLERMRALVEG